SSVPSHQQTRAGDQRTSGCWKLVTGNWRLGTSAVDEEPPPHPLKFLHRRLPGTGDFSRLGAGFDLLTHRRRSCEDVERQLLVLVLVRRVTPVEAARIRRAKRRNESDAGQHRTEP